MVNYCIFDPLNNYHLHRLGNVFVFSVHLSGCEQDISKIYGRIFMKFSGGMGRERIDRILVVMQILLYCDRCCQLVNVHELMYTTRPTLASSSSFVLADVHALHRELYSLKQ